MLDKLKFDCIYFKGHIPCLPNKQRDKTCDTCDEYIPVSKRILIIKLGAIGDVIRTTPLITKYRAIYPSCHITWITLYPEILPKNEINTIYKLDFLFVYKIKNQKYDIAINLDKDVEACVLLKEVYATEKYGFIWRDNHIDVATPQAEHKLITGIFDNFSKKNTKNYMEEIFEICHLKFQGEHYLLNYNQQLAQKWNSLKEDAKGKTIIGLNTGCGKRWQTRLWIEEYWIEFIQQLKSKNYFPILLGGPDEDKGNRNFATQTNAFYPGFFSLEEFIALTSHCQIIVTPVTMMMHIAIGLKIPLVLFNNIFNKHEFELYNNGCIVEPASGCDCYYENNCKRERSCMYDISVSTVMDAVEKMRELSIRNV